MFYYYLIDDKLSSHLMHIHRLFLRLQVTEGNDKINVVLFEEVATVLIGCSTQEYIESIREVYTITLLQKLKLCYAY